MFHVKAASIDDLMFAIFKRLLSGNRNNYRVASRKGQSTEVFGALLELAQPRARLGRSLRRAKAFSPLGELLWYLAASNDLAFIQYYIERYDKFSDDTKTLNGAYGPRIFDPGRSRADGPVVDEWQRVIDKLRAGSGSRNAVIQIYANRDGTIKTEDVPCTCTLQFVVRNSHLHLHVHMRSNDAFLGLPHDIFSFTMLQEIAARELGWELGHYYHSVASLHLYDDTDDLKSRSMAQRYVEEDLHDVVPMPPMPKGDPWPSIRQLVSAEQIIRNGNSDHETSDALDPYWADLVRLLRAYAVDRVDQSPERLEKILGSLSFGGYRLYILDRIEKKNAQQTRTADLFAQGGTANAPGKI